MVCSIDLNANRRFDVPLTAQIEQRDDGLDRLPIVDRGYLQADRSPEIKVAVDS